jgi:hypothetical protein
MVMLCFDHLNQHNANVEQQEKQQNGENMEKIFHLCYSAEYREWAIYPVIYIGKK